MSETQLVATFGEYLIRIQSQSDNLINENAKLYPGGSEANVIYALAQKEIKTRYITALPENKLSEELKGCLAKKNVDVSSIISTGDRIGTYTLLNKNGLTKGEVIYDRKYSSFSQLKKGTVDWGEKLKDCTWLHWTAITPALSQELADVTEELLLVAKDKGIKISVDLNYRSKLWNYGKQPLDIMPKLLSYCDLIMGNIWAANKMLGTSISDNLNRQTSKNEYIFNANKIAEEIFQRLPNCKHIANVFRFMDNDTHNLIYSTYHTRENNYVSNEKETNEIVDRIGSGDAYIAGLLYGIINDMNEQDTVNSALDFGYKKLFVPGDFLEF